MELAKRIRIIREVNGYSQDYMAEKIGISQSAYSRIERKAGSSSFYTLQKVASALNVSLMFLVDIENEKFIETK
jgi:transcriptional regulator with XRE-family HTH domain